MGHGQRPWGGHRPQWSREAPLWTAFVYREAEEAPSRLVQGGACSAQVCGSRLTVEA